MSAEKSKIAITTTAAPSAIGPYSQAIAVGDILYCSGQVPLDPATMQVVGTTSAEQTEQVMKNLGGLLEAGGSSYGDLLKCTIFLKNIGDFAAVNEVYGRYLPSPPPARSTVEVARLPKDVLVEIEAIALITKRR